jgi:hypothetical protein
MRDFYTGSVYHPHMLHKPKSKDKVDPKKIRIPEGSAVVTPGSKIVITQIARRSLKTMRKAKPHDFTVTEANLSQVWQDKKVRCFVIEWGTVSAGYGTLTICQDKKTGKLTADKEAMGNDFCKAVFAKLVDSLPGD